MNSEASPGSFIGFLINLNESRFGKPKNRHELRFLLQWIHEECKLRWPEISKIEIWNTVRNIEGYNKNENRN